MFIKNDKIMSDMNKKYYVGLYYYGVKKNTKKTNRNKRYV